MIGQVNDNPENFFDWSVFGELLWLVNFPRFWLVLALPIRGPWAALRRPLAALSGSAKPHPIIQRGLFMGFHWLWWAHRAAHRMAHVREVNQYESNYKLLKIMINSSFWSEVQCLKLSVWWVWTTLIAQFFINVKNFFYHKIWFIKIIN